MLFAILMAATVAFTIVIVSTPSRVPLGAPAETQIVSATEAISRCLPVSLDGDNECLTTTMTATALREGPAAVYIAVQRLVAQHPDLSVVCHTPGHTVGQEVFKAVGSLEATLPAADVSCGGSYLHGLFDAFGDTSPTAGEYLTAAQSCNALPSDRTNLCFDGLAHNLWRTLRSPQAVSEVCAAAYTAAGRNGCLGGVMMQKYAPLLGEPTDDISSILSTLAPFCAQLPAWPPLPSDPQQITAPCLRAAVYPFRVLFLDKPLFSQQQAGNYSDPAPLDVPMRSYLAACDSLAVDDSKAVAEAVAFCREMIGWHAYLPKPSRNLEIASSICERFLPGDETVRCKTALADLKRIVSES